MTGGLDRYTARRDFDATPEPRGDESAGPGARFVVQRHAARRLHHDFRLEWGGVLLSWAVAKGPSDDPGTRRLAVRTEDHPVSYAGFEGVIPKGQYGAGTVMLWDRGTWRARGDVGEGLKRGSLKFTLDGARMRGDWTLVRMKDGGRGENWLLIKERDGHAGEGADALVARFDTSVASGRKMDAIAAGAPPERIARTGRRPRFRKPQLATLAETAPEGEGWLHETKFDGYRCLAALGEGGTRLYTRNGKDWTDTFAGLAGAFETLPCDAALIDGEVMAREVTGGASPFAALQAALAEGRPLIFVAFDLLSLDGEDLTGERQDARKARLAELLDRTDPGGAIRMATHVAGRGGELYRRACAAGAEGIVSKRADAPYRGGRGEAWLKLKCVRRREFVVGGWRPSDRPGRPFASLLVGERAGGRLVYRGRVGTGFGEREFDTLWPALRAAEESPFDAVPAEVARDARWAVPELVAEIGYADLTGEGHLRHARYVGLRADKAAEEVGEDASEAPRGTAPSSLRVAGVAISNADRVMFPDAGHTKGDLARYYGAVGARLLAVAGGRPLSLLRCPSGIGGERFFQKHAGQGFPKAMGRVEIAEEGGGAATYMQATEAAAFVTAAQMGTVEFHIWPARADRLDRPDRLVFDLDPGPGVEWERVVGAAEEIRDRLAALGLPSVAVLSGGKGVHVCTILRRNVGWETLTLFARTFAHHLAAERAGDFTASMSKRRREGRIFVDWLRNERGATAIAPWSVRAREGAPVAVPVRWDTLREVSGPGSWTLATVEEALDRPCPYLAAAETPATLGRAVIERLGKMVGG